MTTPDFVLEPDGTVTIRLNDVVHHLRRPTIGQLRHFTEAQRRDLVPLSVRTVIESAPVETTQEEGESDRAYLERRAGQAVVDAEKRNKLNDEYETAVVEWVHDALIRLSDRNLCPPVEELPAFMVDRGLPMMLLNHWRSVPLAPGDQ